MLFRALAAWALLTILVPAGAVWAVVLYQIDDGSFDAGAMNSSDGSEARDNWMGNLFTIVPGGETITQVQFQVADYSGTATLGIYADNGDATPPQVATLAYQQDFSLTANSLNVVPLTTPVTLAAGDKMVVGVLIANVPGDKYPYALDSQTALGRSYWDRDFSLAKGDPSDYPMSITDLSKAVATNQLITPMSWRPSDYNCNTAGIRALGVPLPEPASLSLLALGGLALLRRRRK